MKEACVQKITLKSFWKDCLVKWGAASPIRYMYDITVESEMAEI